MIDHAATDWDRRYADDNHAHGERTVDRTSDLTGIVSKLELPSQPRCAVDVGCGAGDDVRWLAGAGFQAVGVDPSAKALQIAAQRTPPGVTVEWLHGSAAALPVSDGSCVLVTDRGCLHHVARDDVRTYAMEVARVLVPNGAWVIRDMIGHPHQHHDLDVGAIRQLVVDVPLHVEVCEVDAERAPSSLLAVLRRV